MEQDYKIRFIWLATHISVYRLGCYAAELHWLDDSGKQRRTIYNHDEDLNMKLDSSNDEYFFRKVVDLAMAEVQTS